MQVKLYRLKADFYDGHKWDLVIAATGMDWVTMWVDNQNGKLIQDMSIMEFCDDINLIVEEEFSMAKGSYENISDFVERVIKSYRRRK